MPKICLTKSKDNKHAKYPHLAQRNLLDLWIVKSLRR